ncbi:T9SS type A sorting domain-containing protein [Fulvivirga sp. M361]|uniref:T9SS type A sorting domain-containing protein n=1 Tax=Fulvivirga sp. M361 TaxID=2594266 RepID=UPI00117A89CB|nr:T9SS type A sorting domain-containing protein [Fulvivirga sp. M361]TRX58822.1 T9SS type A sorting domain-containing protein [Fulvivirga sp. M361]
MRHILFLLFCLLFYHNSIFGATLYSRADGTWSSVNGGSDCSCTPSQNDDLIINHDIVIIGDFTVNTGSITVNSPAILTVTGNLTFDNNSVVVVNLGSTSKVDQDFLNKNNSSDVSILGNLTIDGNFTNGEGSGVGAVLNVGLTGNISIGGTCSNPGTVTDGTNSFQGCENTILPVELLYFTADYNRGSSLIEIEWGTVTEVNSDYFIIERSVNGVDFDSLGYHPAAGNSHHTVKYSWSYPETGSGRSYYRLKAVDRDGTFEYFDVISTVSLLPNSFRVSPNPIQGDHFNILKHNWSEGELMYLYDSTGQLIKKIRMDHKQVKVELTGFIIPGIYLLRSGMEITKLIVQ